MKRPASAPLVEVGPGVHDKDHGQEDDPGGEGARAPWEGDPVEEESNQDRSEDLREPVHQIVQRARTDVEERIVVLVEFCISCVRFIRW